MLNRLPSSLAPRQFQAIANARVESALVHGRALAYFLRSKLPSRSDLHYSHYSKSIWREGAKTLNDEADAIINQASQRLAHATIPHPEWEPHPGAWALTEMATLLVDRFAKFIEALHGKYPERAVWFKPDPRNTLRFLVANDLHLERTDPSDHPDVGGLTLILQDWLDGRFKAELS
jgi:hypothetical protein